MAARRARPSTTSSIPRTGEPAAPVWRTVSVAAASCVDANTASTAAIVRGASAPQWLESLGLPARLVDPSGRRRHRRRMAGGRRDPRRRRPEPAVVPEPRHRRDHARPALGVGDPRDHGDAALAAREPARRASSSTACTATSRCSWSCCWRRTSSPRSSTPSRTCASSTRSSRSRRTTARCGSASARWPSTCSIALIVTSVLRARLGLRAWRAVHWAAYVCWPVAVLHGLGTGTDARSAWLQLLTAACVAGVVAALAARLLRDWPARAGLRLGALAARRRLGRGRRRVRRCRAR